jgi:hypothetical protein
MVPMLRTCGPPMRRATGCRNSRSRCASTSAIVTPAPSVAVSPDTRTSRSAGSAVRTTRAGAVPAFTSRITMVPPPRYTASRPIARAASPIVG